MNNLTLFLLGLGVAVLYAAAVAPLIYFAILENRD